MNRQDYTDNLYRQYRTVLDERDKAIEKLERFDDAIRDALDILTGRTIHKTKTSRIENATTYLQEFLASEVDT